MFIYIRISRVYCVYPMYPVYTVYIFRFRNVICNWIYFHQSNWFAMFWLLSCNAGREASTRGVQRELSSIGAMTGASIREVQGACGCCQQNSWYTHAPKEQTKLPECIFDPRTPIRTSSKHTFTVEGRQSCKKLLHMLEQKLQMLQRKLQKLQSCFKHF